jgi:hypothetical protein
LDGDDLRLDGNAAAGLLAELFRFDMTVALGTCDGCGAERPFGAVTLYGQAMGAILRCPGCDNELIRIGRAGDQYWLDLRGLRCIRVAAPVGRGRRPGRSRTRAGAQSVSEPSPE